MSRKDIRRNLVKTASTWVLFGDVARGVGLACRDDDVGGDASRLGSPGVVATGETGDGFATRRAEPPGVLDSAGADGADREPAHEVMSSAVAVTTTTANQPVEVFLNLALGIG
ncbi:MAG: hypothetical protein ACR2KG_09050 [Nocardioidaceae bacterium]